MGEPVDPRLQYSGQSSIRGRSQSDPAEALIGAIAGVVATTAMTLAADALFRRLPEAERYPLPPRELTEQVAAMAGVRDRLDEPNLQAATLASHFGFGAAVGALYGWFLLRAHPLPMVGGTAYGLFVWTASYLGWVPALGWLRPATKHPARRNALMIAAHVVWGATLGLVADRLARALRPIAGGASHDR
ncbi:DUF1440 domain-containing protein [Inquilinus limosus]|uniref:DUF1440 domain-containing protein n=1 Tax=Inquilinus limosus TaxID=171674 RepID=UPI003F150211